MAARSLKKFKIKIGVFKMAENIKWRVSAYVSEKTYNRLVAYQHDVRKTTGKKISQGKALDELFEKFDLKEK